jgi:hypothetical protein
MRYPLVALLIACLMSSVVFAEGQNRYDEMLQSESHADTVRSIGLGMLAMPYERAVIHPQLTKALWVNSPEVEADETERKAALVRFEKQVEAVQKVVEQYEIRRLELVGFTNVGTVRNLDLYYAANTDHGPVIIRVSVFMTPKGARLFDFVIFEGWDAARDAFDSIRHHAVGRVAAVSYEPKPAPGDDDENNGDKTPSDDASPEPAPN